MKRFAGVDIGSHTVRMLVVEERSGALFPLSHHRRITRLAENFQDKGYLSTTRKRQTLEVLRDYCRILKDFGVAYAFCGATGVVRRAGEKEAFVKDVESALSYPCKVLSEEDEALTAARGTLNVIRARMDLSFYGMPAVLFDLGGGSTEFVVVRSDRLVFSTSVFVGASTITGMFLKDAPVGSGKIREAKEYVDNLLKPAVVEIGRFVDSSFELIGTAGTVATLGAIFLGMMSYEPYRMIGTKLSLPWVEKILKELAGLTFEDRRKIPGLEPGREDVIVGGTLIVHRILSLLGRQEMIVSDAGLLEGLALIAAEEYMGLTPDGIYSPLTWHFEKAKGENNFFDARR
ncbi:hypothetical protein [Thermodesulforhabdus norvegica]|uniref:Exopolyphosphatase / guanosine-5'-triphosphate,3'-diphosphate pyrophosphatase n=1 Tax=Thermodesulforhabdus norvegica TaxID=39841 RepID=A0A1I4R7M8_9BACT|nr:hypothetical protein [Thermodesulforhabdus norvegica]SFM48312.1 exopolyphosphatase / guanosine-5'-triphosphate,3'-diphosphate pyrophosphatase [Thermodesulforhabdus norvegica]